MFYQPVIPKYLAQYIDKDGFSTNLCGMNHGWMKERQNQMYQRRSQSGENTMMSLVFKFKEHPSHLPIFQLLLKFLARLYTPQAVLRLPRAWCGYKLNMKS